MQHFIRSTDRRETPGPARLGPTGFLKPTDRMKGRETMKKLIKLRWKREKAEEGEEEEADGG